MENTKSLNDYAKLYGEISEVFENPEARIAVLRELGKDRRGELASQARENGFSSKGDNSSWREMPATKKQKFLLRSNDVEFDESITKGDASELIDSHIGK